MPYQVSWQSVSMKSQGPVHVLGPEAVVAGDALAAAPSAARASSVQQMPAVARIVAATMLSFFVMAAPLPQTWTILTWKMAAARQSRHLEQIPIPCGARATVFAAESNWTPPIVPTPLI